PRPLAAGRAFHWLRRHDPGRAKPVAKRLLRACWQEGADIGTPETVTAIAASEGVDSAALRDGFDSGEAALLLRAAVDESLAAGAFGSPFFIVDGEPFFGLEKMELLEEWLATGGW
ncbi:MAG: DsbA family protein, partial [Defluviicoccus sp.]|nr:DsbA family protein [Defluviicoccus sp.]